MNKRETTKQVQIEDQTYQINKMDARTACWLFSMLGARAGQGSILSALGRCTRPEFDEVQAAALKAVQRLDHTEGNTFPVEVVSGLGTVADPALRDDAASLYRLTGEAIMFNLDPFFGALGLSSPQPLA